MAHRVAVLLILPCFVGGWLLGSTWFDQPGRQAKSRGSAAASVAYAPSLHPATVALGELFVTLLGLAAFGAKQAGTAD